MFLYLSDTLLFCRSQPIKTVRSNIIIYISEYFCFILMIKVMATATIRFQIGLYVYFAITFT